MDPLASKLQVANSQKKSKGNPKSVRNQAKSQDMISSKNVDGS